jgi:colicin import membrane protein
VNTATTPAPLDERKPPRPAGMGRGAMLAVLIHVGLLVAIAFGVNWRSSEPAGTSAELWAAVPQAAAPAAVEPPPPPPLPKVLPTPEVKPVEAPPPPKPEVRDADIAVEKAKAEKEKREREREEIEQAKKLERERDEKRKREEAEREKRLAAQREQERQAALDKQREENLRRITGQAGATGAPQATGTAQRDAGPSAGYAGKIIARVRPNIVLTETVPPTVRAEVEVRAAPDGTITGKTLRKSSGNAAWDEAVLRAIDRTAELPKDDNGRVPPSIVIGFTPA